ncbi:unnamed protein product [Timema podura]|uniref:Uncharacterized protein n=1 Tax=Timema podura TaxID=61482 RepID=A0ABN7PMC3_TIMPD|nr:unnamed protein product [Timema podura]
MGASQRRNQSHRDWLGLYPAGRVCDRRAYTKSYH